MEIVVDSREDEKIHSLFREENYRKEELPVGDILLPKISVVVERKTYSDLVSSVYSGHLEKQLVQMSKLEMSVFVVVVGTPKDYIFQRMALRKKEKYTHRWGVEHHIGLQISKIRQFPEIHWIFCDNNSQFKKIIFKLYKKFSEYNYATNPIDYTELMRLAQMKITCKKDIHVKMLTAIPGIGIDTARKIINKLESIDNVMQTSKDDIEAIPDIGKTTAKKIYESLH